jgi:two-component system sensor histidine kinase ChvG
MAAHLSTAPGPDGGREDAPGPDTDIAAVPAPSAALGPADEERADTGSHLALRPQTQVRPWRRGRFSSLTFRILALNLIALVALVGGLLYLNQFREGLVEARVEALLIEGQIIAGALGESAVDRKSEAIALDAEAVRQIVRRTTEPTAARARIFGADGALLADSRTLSEAGREVEALSLPEDEESAFFRVVAGTYDRVIALVPERTPLPPYVERTPQSATDYDEVVAALAGEAATRQRALGGGAIITVAVPIQSFKKVLGALLLSVDNTEIERSVRKVRLAILEVSGLALAVTILMSLFLAGTIARPVRRLARAAEGVRTGLRGRMDIPDFSRRRDEIGELSVALRDMTEVLYRRLDAIEGFAADVAHEIRNPLTSLRSAVEALDKAKTPDQLRRLMAIIRDDVDRVDRLITDISDASRLDAELSRSTKTRIDIDALLAAAAEVHMAAGRGGLAFDIDAGQDGLVVQGIENRIGRVIGNVLANAISFSPPGGHVRISARAAGGHTVEISVEDDGPGFPQDALDRVFDRFYTARPESEAFGKHSGLGLSISRQIVEAHHGRIWAENRHEPDGQIIGGRIMIRLPRHTE